MTKYNDHNPFSNKGSSTSPFYSATNQINYPTVDDYNPYKLKTHNNKEY